MKIKAIIILAILNLNLVAQDIEFKDFKWEKNPKLHKLTEEEKKLPEINILKEYVQEYASEGDGFYNFSFVHKITKVNTDDAIQDNNKIYIPYGDDNNILVTKARVINSKGEVIEFDNKDIKEAESENSNYKYFALKGVDIGSEIEYFFLTKEYPETSGSRYKLQTDVPSRLVKFSVIAPNHLIFKFKSYNGFPEVALDDTTLTDKNKWFVDAENIPELKDEEMSANDANIQSIIFKLHSNKYTGKSNLYTYSGISKDYFKGINVERGKKTVKKIKSLLKESGASSETDLLEKVRKLEHYLKINYSYQNFSHPDLKNLDFILENKIYNKTGIMRLYFACFDELEIKNQLVLTSDRFKVKFDGDFESYSFLTEEMFYIDELDKFLHPTGITSRVGYVPFNFTNNYALFIKPVVLGDFKSALGKVKFIDALAHNLSSDTMKITVNFEDDINEPEIYYTKHQKGLEIMSIQPIYDFIEGEDEEDLDEQVAKFINDDVDVEDLKIENKGGENFGKKSFKISAKLKTTDFCIENAGTKYLFKVGELIGPQMEMYQEKGHERKQDVEMYFNHSYYRTIEFNIPEGYKIKNLDDLNFDVSITYEGKKSSYFISSYKIVGNKVIWTNEEVYDAINYPKAIFEKYRDVINAAADFNKVVLVLEKI